MRSRLLFVTYPKFWSNLVIPFCNWSRWLRVIKENLEKSHFLVQDLAKTKNLYVDSINMINIESIARFRIAILAIAFKLIFKITF